MRILRAASKAALHSSWCPRRAHPALPRRHSLRVAASLASEHVALLFASARCLTRAGLPTSGHALREAGTLLSSLLYSQHLQCFAWGEHSVGLSGK